MEILWCCYVSCSCVPIVLENKLFIGCGCFCLAGVYFLWGLCAVSAAQRPKSFKTDVGSASVVKGCKLCLPWSLLAAERPKSIETGLPSCSVLSFLGCVLLSLSGGPLWPLRGPNLSKRVSPAVLFFLSMSVCSFFFLVVRLSL